MDTLLLSWTFTRHILDYNNTSLHLCQHTFYISSKYFLYPTVSIFSFFTITTVSFSSPFHHNTLTIPTFITTHIFLILYVIFLSGGVFGVWGEYRRVWRIRYWVMRENITTPSRRRHQCDAWQARRPGVWEWKDGIVSKMGVETKCSDSRVLIERFVVGSFIETYL